MTPRHLLFLSLASFLATACGGDDGDGGGAADASPSDAQVSGSADAAADAQPVPDAAPAGTVCQTKDPVFQVGHSCNLVWSDCTGGDAYAIDCRIENAGGLVFSLCDCLRNGAKTGEFLSSDVCSQADWASVEAIVNEHCGWDLL